MKKKYCETCKYYSGSIYDSYCKTIYDIKYEDNWREQIKKRVMMKDKNKNNDCKDYERASSLIIWWRKIIDHGIN